MRRVAEAMRFAVPGAGLPVDRQRLLETGDCALTLELGQLSAQVTGCSPTRGGFSSTLRLYG
jgi:hypothetical protein